MLIFQLETAMSKPTLLTNPKNDQENPEINSSILFQTKPSFTKGLVKSFNLFGSLNTHRKLTSSSDYNSLKQDWLLVGSDLWEALNIYGQKQRNLKRS
jgi:hypothetical protein